MKTELSNLEKKLLEGISPDFFELLELALKPSNVLTESLCHLLNKEQHEAAGELAASLTQAQANMLWLVGKYKEYVTPKPPEDTQLTLNVDHPADPENKV